MGRGFEVTLRTSINFNVIILKVKNSESSLNSLSSNRIAYGVKIFVTNGTF